MMVGFGGGVDIVAQLVPETISPTEGSIWGGQEVTITGVGFDDETTVDINSVRCDVSYSNTTMVCYVMYLFCSSIYFYCIYIFTIILHYGNFTSVIALRKIYDKSFTQLHPNIITP